MDQKPDDTPESRGFLGRMAETNLRQPGRIGCVFGLVAGVGAGYVPAVQQAVAGVCPREKQAEFSACWDASMMGAVLVATLVSVAVEGGLGLVRRRRMNGPR